MSSKTKIVVLHLKELIYTGIFIVLGILLIVLLIFMFLPEKETSPQTTPTSQYIAGVYTSSIDLNNHTLDLKVVVDNNHINSISLSNLDETTTTMYPLMQPALDELCEQIYKNQSLEDISYSPTNQYTSAILLKAIDSALAKAEKK
ncbi:hypothetical protein [Anaerosacchariphilus polymeriproducens]|uniref:FMN-binding domain-containing protein n=1 Tax=Anaerosacchariphilus polymeriproducens TaxID=1812858 RepID=A0A371AWF9_9FIRM|nr:hypothetical protein [Anaerosacchariphilus polymeriproducens]RDU23934.1 hypothetical protein DWV06_06475 [Anaerosacchariphilus polymeriproducens]